MTNEDLFREILVNRVFLIVMLLGGAISYAYVGFVAWVSIRIARQRAGEFILLSQLLLKKLNTPPEKPAE